MKSPDVHPRRLTPSSLEGEVRGSDYDNTVRVLRNNGKFTGQKPPLRLMEIWAVRTCLQRSMRTGDLAMSQQVESIQSDQTESAWQLSRPRRRITGNLQRYRSIESRVYSGARSVTMRSHAGRREGCSTPALIRVTVSAQPRAQVDDHLDCAGIEDSAELALQRVLQGEIKADNDQ